MRVSLKTYGMGGKDVDEDQCYAKKKMSVRLKAVVAWVFDIVDILSLMCLSWLPRCVRRARSR